jgi:dolichyl-phosphate-mannose--protein O-mannosyl transferase
MLAKLRSWLNRPVVAVVAVGLIAGAVRFVHLGYPTTSVFDEAYYPKAACIYLGYSNDRCRIDTKDERYWRTNEWDVGSWVHPPLGKWAIAMGELVAGTDAFGWRVSAATAGTLTVMMVAVMAWLLWGSALWAFVAGLLLAFENLHFTVSRTGILDIFVAFWIVAGFLCMLLDRRWIERRTPEPTPEAERPPLAAPLWRPWRFAAGVAFGAGLATKWSAATGIFASVVLAYIWEASRRRRAGREKALWQAISIETFGLVLALVAVPIVIYVLAYVPWLNHFHWDWGHLVRTTKGAFKFQTSLRPSQEGNPSQVGEWEWLLLYRPTLFYKVTDGTTTWGIWANGNPAIFWGGLIAIPFTIVSWIRTKAWQAGFISITFLSLYLPWFLSNHPEYIFYAVPLSPFLVLACTYTIRRVAQVTVGDEEKTTRPFIPIAVAFVVIAIGLFIWFWPVMTAGPLSDHALTLRQWLPAWR